VRYYLVPKIGSGGSMTDPMRPKYVDPDALGPGWNVGPWLTMRYGAEDTYILQLNLSAQDHTTLSAQPT
jgi:hypothetical protein